MKLHLPKVLFTAVVAALACVQQAGAADYTYGTSDNNNASKLTTPTAEDTITFDKESGYLTSGGGTINAQVVINNLTLTDGYSGVTYTFTNTVTGTGNFSFAPTTAADNQHYEFSGDVSGYSGNMSIADNKSGSFTFSNKSGTGTISGAKVTVNANNATMNNSAITASAVNVTGTTSFVGTVNTGTLTINAESAATFDKNLTVGSTLTNNGSLTIGENSTLSLSSAITGSGTSITFGDSAAIALTDGYIAFASGALEHDTYGFKVNRAADLLGGSMTANREVTVNVNGEAMTMATDGTVAGLNDNSYYISGAVSASTINAAGEIGTDTHIRMDGGTLTMDENFTVSSSALITATAIEGEGKLIVAEGTTVQVNSTGKILKSNMEIQSGGTMEFLGTGEDAINYDQRGRAITVDGTMDVGTTRQTVGGWTFNMTGGTIKGAGQASQNSVGLDFHNAGENNPGVINAKAATDATAEAPTVSTISTKVRYNGALTIAVEENARLDVTGVIAAGNKLTKSGAGTLRLANNDNDYSDKAFDVTGGTLELRDNAKTLNGAVTVSNGATLALLQTDGSANTLANVTLNNGSLLTQSTGGNYTTTLTSLTVGAEGATIGTMRDTVYGNNSYQTTMAITALTGTGDLTVTSMSNTNNATTIRVDGGTGYSGTVKVQNGTDTSGRITNLALNSDTALAGAVVELGGGDNDAAGVTTNLVLAAANTAVKGIQDAADRKSAGNVTSSSGDTVSTLTINTGDASYSTKSGVGNSISLVKKGTGTQTFGGDMSAFNGTITANGGTLAFTNAAEDATMSVESLTLSGGTMEVTGALTLNTVDVDFEAYFNAEQLSTTLVTAGTLRGWSESVVGSYTSDGTQYTTTISQSGNSLVLTFAEVVESGSLLVDSASLTGNMLTLNVNANLSDISSVDLMLSEAALQTIAGQSGLVSITVVGLEDTGFSTVGEGAGNVSFYNGAYAGEGNGMYQIAYIPEPATATLSLLALAGLAARRRRR